MEINKLKNCSVPEWVDKYKCKGYCNHHYNNLLVRGDPLKTAIPKFSKNRHSLPEYKSYSEMKYRCYNKNGKQYADYGERGISICKEWLGPSGFCAFFKDMGEKPSKDYSLDRIDNNKGYSKENCRWATRHTQNSNKRNNVDVVGVTFDGKRNFYEARLIVNHVCYRFRTKDKVEAINKRVHFESVYLNIIRTKIEKR